MCSLWIDYRAANATATAVVCILFPFIDFMIAVFNGSWCGMLFSWLLLIATKVTVVTVPNFITVCS